MAVGTKEIQKLRELTGAGVIDCKKALESANGSLERAKEIIREKGQTRMEKRSNRKTGAGAIHSYIHNGRIGVLVDLRAETDFVVRTDEFQELLHELAMQIAAAGPKDTEELLKQPYIKDESKTVESIIQDVSAKTGEVIKVNAFSRMEI